MLLAIDVGNTQTAIGLFDGADLVSHWRIATSAERTSDEHALVLSQLLQLGGHAPDEAVTGICLSSTVPRLKTALRDMAERWFAVPTVVVGPGVRSGVPILYDSPHEVGADRIANAVAAHDKYGGPSIVVDFGTATTFDAISASGEYLGGAIVPGVEVSVDALFERAAGLRRVELLEPRHVIGRTTLEAVGSGVLYGFAALVDGLCERFASELGECTVVATGGLSHLVVPFAGAIHHDEPWLTLQGLRLLFERNAA